MEKSETLAAWLFISSTPLEHNPKTGRGEEYMYIKDVAFSPVAVSCRITVEVAINLFDLHMDMQLEFKVLIG